MCFLFSFLNATVRACLRLWAWCVLFSVYVCSFALYCIFASEQINDDVTCICTLSTVWSLELQNTIAKCVDVAS